MFSEFDSPSHELRNTAVAVVTSLALFLLSLYSIYRESSIIKKKSTKMDLAAKCPFQSLKKDKTTIESVSKLIPQDHPHVDTIKNINKKTNDKEDQTNKADTKEHKINKETHFDALFNPKAIIADGKNKKKKKKLPKVEHLGCTGLQELQKYHCDADRQIISLFGILFDVTNAPDKYGKDGVYKEFAGHDITLALGSGKLNEKWLDRFVKFSPKHEECAKGWIEFYQNQYPMAGALDKWSENTKKWPELTEKELEELNAECIVM